MYQIFVKSPLESHLLGKKIFLGATGEIGKNGKSIFRILPSIRVVGLQMQSGSGLRCITYCFEKVIQAR